jgi:ubiquinone/menaquinone biosynthesis C-methylase UbiE
MAAWKVVLIVIASFAAFQVLLRVFRKTIHFPAPAFMGRLLDSGWRRTLQRPGTMIQRSGISAGMIVLELGCGSGAFTPYVAREIGSGGKLYALDIQEGMLAQLNAKLAAPRFSDVANVIPTLGSAYELPFEDGFFDLAYFVTVFQEIPDRERALAEVKRVLKPGGTLAITELLLDPDYPLKRTTIRLGATAGFILEEAAGGIWTYTARFRRP